MTKLEALLTARLYAIFDTGYAEQNLLEKYFDAMLAGGVDIIQIRAKNLPQEQIFDLAKLAVHYLKGSDIPLIINDHPAIAAETGADGVHIGQDDGEIQQTRSSYPQLLTGRSTHSLQQAQQAAQDGADYIGFGPLYPTPTKAGRPAIGLGDLQNVHHCVKIPIFAIGGIKLHNLKDVLQAGARRVVVVSGILQASDMKNMCLRLKEILHATPFNEA